MRERNANQIEELGTLFRDFTAVASAVADYVGPELQRFHESMTERLNEKVAELHDLRTQNEVMERKLENIHRLFSTGKEGARLIINASLGESPREATDLSSEPQQYTEPQPQPSTDEIERPVTFSVLGNDVLGIIFGWLCNPLNPRAALDFSSASLGLREPTQALLQQLRADHEAAAALCRKVGMLSCKELCEAKMVDWRDKGLSSHDLALLGTLGSVLPALEGLVLIEPAAGPDGGQRLAAGLGAGAMPAMAELQLINMNVGDAGASALAAALGRGALPRLEELFLNEAAVGDVGLVALAPALRRLPALEKLYLQGNPISLVSLVTPLVARPLCLSTYCATCSPSVAGGLRLTKLKQLILNNTQITDAGLVALAPALRRLPALLVLSLAGNPLGDEGLAALVAPLLPAGALSPPTGMLTKLEQLWLKFTQVTDAGCTTLVAALDSGALPALGGSI